MPDKATSSGRGAAVALHVRAVGVWGGTLDTERLAVAHLPVSEAVEALERTFPERLVGGSGRSSGRGPGRRGRAATERLACFTLQFGAGMAVPWMSQSWVEKDVLMSRLSVMTRASSRYVRTTVSSAVELDASAKTMGVGLVPKSCHTG